MEENALKIDAEGQIYSLRCEPISIFMEIYMDYAKNRKIFFAAVIVLTVIYSGLGMLMYNQDDFKLLGLIFLIFQVGLICVLLDYFRRVCYRYYGEVTFRKTGFCLKGNSKCLLFPWKKGFVDVPWDSVINYNVFRVGHLNTLSVGITKNNVVGEWANISPHSGIYVFYDYDSSGKEYYVRSIEIKWLNTEHINRAKAIFAENNIQYKLDL